MLSSTTYGSAYISAIAIIFIPLSGFSSLGRGRPWKESFCPFWPYLVGPYMLKISYVSGCY
jgi:hypothetical protein